MSQEKIIYGTWTSVFINLIIDATEKWRFGNYLGAYDTMKVLLAWMPEICVKECQPIYKTFEDNYIKNCTIEEYGYSNRATKTANSYLHKNLLSLFTTVRTSLEKNGYLGKDSGASPRSSHKAHIGET
jgi:hypothetical protein